MVREADIRRWALSALLLIVASRVVVLLLTPNDLHGDEAQYAAWSRELAGGYFSKPPLVAWAIRASTEVFGTAEWAVRLWSPLAHGLAALALWRAGARLFDEVTGAWAALAYLTLPGVVLSSAIASTDALVLLWTAVLLWAWTELREGGRSWRWTLVAGAALGLGALSKYAAVFPLVGLAAVWVTDRPTREALPLPRVAVVAAVAGVMLLPNLLWNLRHDFATARHTASNANLNAELLNPLEGLEFFGSQFGVWGPVVFGLFLAAVVRGWREPRTRALALVALAPLLVILVQAFVSRANANWAATALMPGTLLTVAVWHGWWRASAVGVNALVALVMSVALVSPGFADAVGLANSFKRVRAWPETVEALAARAEDVGAQTVAVDNRITFYGLDHYGLGERVPVAMWQMEAVPHNHAELTRPLVEGAGEPMLFVNYHTVHRARVEADFAEVEVLEPLRVELGGGKVRELELLLVSGYRRAER